MRGVSMGEPGSGFAFLEHTADVGIRAWGPSVAAAFEEAARGLATLMGATAPSPGRSVPIHVEAHDTEALLVAFLDELVFLFETEEGQGLASLDVRLRSATALDADVVLAPLDAAGEGLLVKTATYHRLAVTVRPDGSAEAEVYLDV
ncbi:MAG: archease [Actinomycetota bacterium]